MQPLGSARDWFPISASSANNVFGKPYTATAGGDARACAAIYCDAATTISFIAATGIARANLVLPQGVFQAQIIQVTVISGGNVWGALPE